MSCQTMMSLGVYVLGAAEAGERAQVEAHLPGCPACQAELLRLAPLPGLLSGLRADMRAPCQRAGRAARSSRPTGGHDRPRRRALAAAAAFLAAAAAAGGFWLAPASGTHRPGPVTLSGANLALHVNVTAALTATSWGTSIQLRLRGVPLNVPCRLVVRSRTGAAEVAGIWEAWRNGTISVPASAAWLPSDIASLQVATPAKTLVTITVAHPAARSGARRVRGKRRDARSGPVGAAVLRLPADG